MSFVIPPARICFIGFIKKRPLVRLPSRSKISLRETTGGAPLIHDVAAASEALTGVIFHGVKQPRQRRRRRPVFTVAGRKEAAGAESDLCCEKSATTTARETKMDDSVLRATPTEGLL